MQSWNHLLDKVDDDELLMWSQCTNFHRVATLHCRNNTDVTHTLIMIPITEFIMFSQSYMTYLDFHAIYSTLIVIVTKHSIFEPC